MEKIVLGTTIDGPTREVAVLSPTGVTFMQAATDAPQPCNVCGCPMPEVGVTSCVWEEIDGRPHKHYRCSRCHVQAPEGWAMCDEKTNPKEEER